MKIGTRGLLLSLATGVIAILLGIAVMVRFNVSGHFEGVYLLRDSRDGRYLLEDHLYVGEGTSLLWSKDFTPFEQRTLDLFTPDHNEGTPHLHCEWSPRNGSGRVSQYYANGTSLITFFGRYLDNDEEVHGLFVGGGMPDTVASNANINMNNSGMTFGDGKRWYHIWCSVNEGIGSIASQQIYTPSQWKFLGSRVVSRSDRAVVITSSHQVAFDGQPLRIDRRASFAAGETYFDLEIRITNQGKTPLTYTYFYGDEPWVGYYGTALGDVGWVQGRLVNYEEVIDSSRYSYAGMFDGGNRVIGEQPVYSNLANFIEWFGDERPLVYFANKGEPPTPGTHNPLESNERYIGLEWDRTLVPGETTTIRLAIGMAGIDPVSGLPRKPTTSWK